MFKNVIKMALLHRLEKKKFFMAYFLYSKVVESDLAFGLDVYFAIHLVGFLYRYLWISNHQIIII